MAKNGENNQERWFLQKSGVFVQSFPESEDQPKALNNGNLFALPGSPGGLFLQRWDSNAGVLSSHNFNQK